MYVFKFKDTVDGNYIFVLDKHEEDAREQVATVTSIPVVLVDVKHVSDIGSLIIYNTVAPF
jgi:translation initiation factor 6 (eIF-6)